MREDISFFIKNLWLWKCELPEKEVKQILPDVENLRKTQWSDIFEKLMRNRLVMGAIRYGLFGANGKPHYDSINSIRKRLDLYEKTGNDEILVDIANLAMVEFIEGKHPLKHFKSVDDTIVHAEEKR
jgi:hypothetical protein